MDAILNFMGNGGIYLAVILLVITVAISVIGSILNMLSDFDSSKKALIGILGLVVLFLIGFALSSGDVPAYAVEAGQTSSSFKLIGAFINTALIATTIVAVYIVVDLILGMIRR